MKSKKIIITIFISFFFLSAIGQTMSAEDSVKKREPLDYSNTQQIDLSGLFNVYSKLKSSTLIVLNKNKILSIDDKEFTSLRRDNITSIIIVNDEKSKTPIKNIIYVSTK